MEMGVVGGEDCVGIPGSNVVMGFEKLTINLAWPSLPLDCSTITPPPTSPGLSSKPPNIPSPLYFPDIGLVIGDADRFDPSQPLRSQLSTVSWDGRELVNVNAKPIPYNRAKGGYFKEGDIVVLDLNLDGPQTSLGFRKNGVDCG